MTDRESEHSEWRVTVPSAEEWERDAAWGVGFVALFVLVVLVGSGFDGQKLGPIGDWFGGLLNPLVALMALIGLAHSVKVQRKAMKDAKDNFAEQLSLGQRQATRDTFFDLLTLRGEAVASVSWTDGVEKVAGRQAMKAILLELKRQTETSVTTTAYFSPDQLVRWGVPDATPARVLPYLGLFAASYSHDVQALKDALQDSPYEPSDNPLLNLESELGHVFRATFQILKFVYTADLTDGQKFDLVNYLRAQMSEYEFALYALSACTKIGEKSRAAATTFDLFENRLKPLAWMSAIAELFDPKIPANVFFCRGLGYIPIEKPKREMPAVTRELRSR